MRMLLCCALVMVVSAVYAEDKVEKIDAKKLAGKWQETGKDKEVTEFTADGKIRISPAQKKEPIEGTYTLDGNKIKVKIKFGKEEITETLTVTKLTDTDLTFTSEDNKKPVTFTRLKDK